MEGKLLSMNPVFDDSGEIVRRTRDEPPMHCILKVDSFSVLQKALSDSYFESTEFSAGGYKWVMTVYQNGNKKEQGEGYLSLYVSMLDEANRGYVVRAQLRFLVHDQIRDKYLCVQCVKEKRFYPMKSTWGIPQFLSLATFTDASNGFLLNDRCAFGVEVLVPGGCLHVPSLSIVDKDYNYRTFTWRIEEFSKLNQLTISSVQFSFDGWTWKLDLFPKGAGDGYGNSLSIYMTLKNGDDLICGSKLFAKYSISIKNQEKNADYKMETVSRWFTSTTPAWGFNKFLGLDELRNLENCLLVKDTLVVEVLMEVMFVLKDNKAKENEEQ